MVGVGDSSLEATGTMRPATGRLKYRTLELRPVNVAADHFFELMDPTTERRAVVMYSNDVTARPDGHEAAQCGPGSRGAWPRRGLRRRRRIRPK